MTTAGHNVHTTHYFGSPIGSKIPVPVTSRTSSFNNISTSNSLSLSSSQVLSSPSSLRSSNHLNSETNNLQSNLKSPISKNASSSNLPPSKPPRFEAYVMTGDIIINLANTKSNDNILGHSATFNNFKNRKQITTPNLHSVLNENLTQFKLKKTSTSLPVSPAEQKESISLNSDINSSGPILLNHLNQNHSNESNFDYNVRLSKIENHVTKNSPKTYELDLVENDCQSQNNLVNTLSSQPLKDTLENESGISKNSTLPSNCVTSTSPNDKEFSSKLNLNLSHQANNCKTKSCKSMDSKQKFDVNFDSKNDEKISTFIASSSSHSYNTYIKSTSSNFNNNGINNIVNNSPSPQVFSNQDLSLKTNSAEQTSFLESEMLINSSKNNLDINNQGKNPQQLLSNDFNKNSKPNHKNASSLDDKSSESCGTPVFSSKNNETSFQNVDLLSFQSDSNNSSEKKISAKRYPSFISTNVNQNEKSLKKEDLSQPKSEMSLSSASQNLLIKEELVSPENYQCSPSLKNVEIASASRLAKRLFNLEGFKRSDVCHHLSKNNEFAQAVAEEYLKFFYFENDRIDSALRKFLNEFCLFGETQERERVLQHFSKRYLDCNLGLFKSSDSIHTLTCALMLLNSDLHGENIGRKMTCAEFIENLNNLNDGDDYSKDLLTSLYHSIKSQPLQWAYDENDPNLTCSNDKSRFGLFGFGSNPTNLNSSFNVENPFLKLPNPNSATEYKRGYMMRKCCFDSSGKRTPLGKRSWKMFYATLRDLVLYLHHDEQGFRKNQLYQSLNNSIRIHHALATNASDYTKKEYVFRLQTADQSEYLFQTSDARELESWIETINLVASILSSPPLPSAIGSKSKKFQKPLLPSSHTKLPIRDQLMDHENQIARLNLEFEDHVSKHPERGSSKRILSDFAEKQSYLEYEIKRYSTYVCILKTKLQQTFGPQFFTDKKPNLTKSFPLSTISIGEKSDSEKGEKYQKERKPVMKARTRI